MYEFMDQTSEEYRVRFDHVEVVKHDTYKLDVICIALFRLVF